MRILMNGKAANISEWSNIELVEKFTDTVVNVRINEDTKWFILNYFLFQDIMDECKIRVERKDPEITYFFHEFRNMIKAGGRLETPETE